MERKQNNSNWLKLGIAVLTPLAVGSIGAIAMTGEIGNWYAGLVKPAFNPPDWIFGPVWTTLYVLMGVALYLVWRQPGYDRKAVIAFWVQLALNLAWSYIFFAGHFIGVALAEIILLFAAILYTIAQFAKTSKLAAWLMVPYLVWVAFASVLNAAIFLLN